MWLCSLTSSAINKMNPIHSILYEAKGIHKHFYLSEVAHVQKHLCLIAASMLYNSVSMQKCMKSPHVTLV